MMACAVTDLPEPDSPTIAVTAPEQTRKPMPFTTSTGEPFTSNATLQIADAKNLTLIQLVVSPNPLTMFNCFAGPCVGPAARRLGNPLRMLSIFRCWPVDQDFMFSAACAYPPPAPSRKWKCESDVTDGT